MIVKERFSKRAVMKRMGSDGCVFNREDNTKEDLARVTAKS